MTSKRWNAFRTIIMMFMAAILTLPVGIVSSDEAVLDGPVLEGDGTEDPGEDKTAENMDPPTRSEPWLEWERISYHSGGQDGGMVYNSTTNKAYIYGGGYYQTGMGGGHRAYNDMFAYNFDTERWEAMLYTYGPGARYRFSYAADEKNGKLYVYGGVEDGGWRNDLWVFDVATESWSKPQSALLGVQRCWAPMVLDVENQNLYIHMGQGDNTQQNSNLSGFFKVDIENNFAVTTLPNDGREKGMELRYSHDMAIDEIGDKIYMWGGYHKMDDNNGFYMEELWEYDLITGEWNKLMTPIGIGQKGGSKMFFRPLDKAVHIWGGLNGSVRDQRLWSYDTLSGEWSVSDLGNSISGLYRYVRAYSSVDDIFVIFGGSTGYTQRSIAYLDMSALEWHTFEDDVRSPTRDNGIFAHDRDRGRLYYIGPNVNPSYGGNGTAYLYYFDLPTRKWVGPFWNPGAEDPVSRSDSAMCYVPDENAVYMYGGMTSWGRNPTNYLAYSDFWRIDLETHTWTKIYESAGPGPRTSTDLVYNPNDGLIYFYGGYNYPVQTSSDKEVYGDMYSFDPDSKMFNQFLGLSPMPGGRWGSGFVMDTDMNEMYLFGGWHEKATNPDYDYDMWKFNFTNRKWSEMDWAEYSPSARAYAKLVYDPLTREILLSGGSDDYLMSYRILENSYNDNLYVVPNHGTLDQHAAYFDVETRDLWIFGASRHGIWKIGVPVRLSVQEVMFNDPDSDSNIAYAMLRPYTFSAKVKTVNDPADLDTISIELKHNEGSLRMHYDNIGDTWSIVDKGDYVDVIDTSVEWTGNTAKVEFTLKFHWNWSTPSSHFNRMFRIEASGEDILGDSLTIFDFLRVRNKLTHEGELMVASEVQGDIQNGSWTQCNELVTFTGPRIVYAGGDSIYPAPGTFTLNLWSDNGERVYRNMTPGEMVNFSMMTPENSQNDVDYTINITGIPEENDLTDLHFVLNTDGTMPSAPGLVTIHADSFEDTRTRYDNDTEIYVTWQVSLDTGGSGVRTYYWGYEDGSGSRNGTPVNTTQLKLMLPGKGEYTIFVWAEDRVGNLGPSRNSTILVDMETIQFNIISPSLENWLPYNEIDIAINITDMGGSRLKSGSIYYRYTSMGLNDRENWLGSNAWKWVQEYYTTEEKETFIFRTTLKGLSEGDDNYLQLKAIDCAGTEKHSEVYNIMVDTLLRYPDVELIAPANGAQFETASNIKLNWSVKFFLPSDVTYDIYLDRDEELVASRDPEALWHTTRELEHIPLGVTFGTYYWTVIPRAKEVWVGNCTSGVYSFTIKDDENYAIKVTSDTASLKIPQEQASFIEFYITNQGQNVATIRDLTYSVPPGVTVSWDKDMDDISAWGDISIGGGLYLTANIRVSIVAPPGTYTLTFYFNTTMGVKEKSEINLNVTPMIEDKPPVEGEDNTLTMIIAAAILAVIVIIGVAALYFFVLRKKPEDKTKYGYGSIDDLEAELGIDSKTAPQPMGLRRSEDEKKKVGGIEEGPIVQQSSPEDMEGETEEEEELIPQLAEEGSEDDWMNLVARETLAVETGESDHIPGEKIKSAQSSDSGKSLSDLLAEMTESVDDE